IEHRTLAISEAVLSPFYFDAEDLTPHLEENVRVSFAADRNYLTSRFCEQAGDTVMCKEGAFLGALQELGLNFAIRKGSSSLRILVNMTELGTLLPTVTAVFSRCVFDGAQSCYVGSFLRLNLQVGLEHREGCGRFASCAAGHFE